MRHRPLLIIFILTLIGCNDEKTTKSSFEALEFSYTNTFTTSFSIKFSSDDTVYIVQHFPKPQQTFKGFLTSTQRQRLDSFNNQIDFKSLDTLYYQTYEDGDGYQFHLKQPLQTKIVFAHNDSVPDNLRQFAYWIVRTKESLKLLPIDTAIEFKDIGFFKPPEVPPPPVNNR